MRGPLDIAVGGFGVIWGHHRRGAGRDGGRRGWEQPSGLELDAGRGRRGSGNQWKYCMSVYHRMVFKCVVK